MNHTPCAKLNTKTPKSKNAMRTMLLLFLGLSQWWLTAQHTISGTFAPASDYTYLIAYHLKPGTQTYVNSARINKGDFTLTLPEDAVAGTYRMVYAMPQEEFYFDLIYNGKEDISLAFEAESGVTILASKENKRSKPLSSFSLPFLYSM